MVRAIVDVVPSSSHYTIHLLLCQCVSVFIKFELDSSRTISNESNWFFSGFVSSFSHGKSFWQFDFKLKEQFDLLAWKHFKNILELQSLFFKNKFIEYSRIQIAFLVLFHFKIALRFQKCFWKFYFDFEIRIVKGCLFPDKFSPKRIQHLQNICVYFQVFLFAYWTFQFCSRKKIFKIIEKMD